MCSELCVGVSSFYFIHSACYWLKSCSVCLCLRGRGEKVKRGLVCRGTPAHRKSSGTLLHFVHQRGTPESTLPRFNKWKGTPECTAPPLVYLKGILEGASSCFFYHRGIQEGIFSKSTEGVIAPLPPLWVHQWIFALNAFLMDFMKSFAKVETLLGLTTRTLLIS